MKNRIPYLIILLCLSPYLLAQIPYAFRYQASVRDNKNRPINHEVVFDIRLYADQDANNELYREIHIAQPDTNGIVAFSIGQGASNDDFTSLQWAEGPHFIQVLLDDEEISFSQLVSVPYALHAATASALHDLKDPIFENDPSTKKYVDTHYQFLVDSIAQLNRILDNNLHKSKAYADSLAIAPKDLEIASSGDTLQIGNKKIVIAGMSSENLEKYPSQRCLGGAYNETIVQSLRCDDQGLILLGNTNSGNGDVKNFKGTSDTWVVKTDKNFNIQWQQTIGGSLYDHAAFIQIEDDGYLVAGTSESQDFGIENNGDFDVLLTKLNKEGQVVWSTNYGGSNTEFINQVIKLENNHYLIGATTFSNDGDVNWNYGSADIWIFEIDANLNIIKERIIGGSRYDALQSITIENDNSYTIWGTSASSDGTITNSHGNLDIFKTRLDQSLDIQSNTCFGSSDNEQLTGIYIEDNNTIIYGQSFDSQLTIENNIALNNMYIQSLGSNNWTTLLGGQNIDKVIDIAISNDTINILAQTRSSDGDISNLIGAQDIWFIQLDRTGKIINNKCLGGTYNEEAQIMLPWQGGWLIGGSSESNDHDLNHNAGLQDIWLVLVDKELNILWQESFGGSHNEMLNNIIPLSENKITIIGSTASNDYRIIGLHDKAGTSSDIWLLNTTIDYK